MGEPTNKGESPLGLAGKKLLEHAEKQAGWLPLLGCVWLAVRKYDVRLPERLSWVHVPDEWTIPFVTLALFLLGDALDKAVFKKRVPKLDGKAGETKLTIRWPDSWPHARWNAARGDVEKEPLKLGSGSYSAAMGVVEESMHLPLWIVGTNELAKFLRSLVIPALVVAGWLLFRRGAFGALALEIVGVITAAMFVQRTDATTGTRTWWQRLQDPRFDLLVLTASAFALCVAITLFTGAGWPLLLLGVAAASLLGYLYLKHWHVCLVYEAAVRRARDHADEFTAVDLRDQHGRAVRLVLWDGKFVGSAMTANVTVPDDAPHPHSNTPPASHRAADTRVPNAAPARSHTAPASGSPATSSRSQRRRRPR